MKTNVIKVCSGNIIGEKRKVKNVEPEPSLNVETYNFTLKNEAKKNYWRFNK